MAKPGKQPRHIRPLRPFKVDPAPLPLGLHASSSNSSNTNNNKPRLTNRGAAGRQSMVGLKASGKPISSSPLKADRNSINNNSGFHVRPTKADSIPAPRKARAPHSIFLPPARPRLGQSPKGGHFKIISKSPNPRPLLGLPHFITRPAASSSVATTTTAATNASSYFSSSSSARSPSKPTTPKRNPFQSCREGRLSLSDLSLPSSPALSVSSVSSDESPKVRSTFVERLMDPLDKYRPEMEPIKTFLRLRPLSADQLSTEHGYVEVLNDTDILMRPPANATRVRSKEPSKYKFTKVFGQATTQDAVFEQVGLPLLTPVLRQDHYNTLLFAYGVSNSGKTFTVLGTEEHPGILPHALGVIFRSIEAATSDDSDEAAHYRPVGFQDIEMCEPSSINRLPAETTDESDSVWDDSHLQGTHVVDLPSGMDYAVWMSIAEIYTERIYDLLAEPPNPTLTSLGGPSIIPTTSTTAATAAVVDGFGRPEVRRPSLALKTDPSSHHKYIHGLREFCVRDMQEAMSVVRAGLKQRQVFSTMLNQSSSRSHCIFTIKIVKVPRAGAGAGRDGAQKDRGTSVSRISIVDLAGSERVRHTNNTGQRLKEAGNINNSLMVLGQCMEVLRLNQTRRGKTPQLVPFRHSKLTELFQSTLEGGSQERSNCQAAMIVNVNPFETSFDENTHVMKFSSVAMNVATLRQAGSRENGNFVRRVTPTKKPSSHRVSPTLSAFQTSQTSKEGRGGREEAGAEEEEEDDPQVALLLSQVEDLREKWLEAESRCSTIEGEIREEMAEEMEQRLQQMEAFFRHRLDDEASMNETKIGRKIDLITRTKSNEEATVVQGLHRQIQQLEAVAQDRQLEVERTLQALAEAERRHQEQAKVVEELQGQLMQWTRWLEAAPNMAFKGTSNAQLIRQDKALPCRDTESLSREEVEEEKERQPSPKATRLLLDHVQGDVGTNQDHSCDSQKQALEEPMEMAEQQEEANASGEDQKAQAKEDMPMISVEMEAEQWQNKRRVAEDQEEEATKDISASHRDSIPPIQASMGNSLSPRTRNQSIGPLHDAVCSMFTELEHTAEARAATVAQEGQPMLEATEEFPRPHSSTTVQDVHASPSHTLATVQGVHASSPHTSTTFQGAHASSSHPSTPPQDSRPVAKKVCLDGGVSAGTQWHEDEASDQDDDEEEEEEEEEEEGPEESDAGNQPEAGFEHPVDSDEDMNASDESVEGGQKADSLEEPIAGGHEGATSGEQVGDHENITFEESSVSDEEDIASGEPSINGYEGDDFGEPTAMDYDGNTVEEQAPKGKEQGAYDDPMVGHEEEENDPKSVTDESLASESEESQMNQTYSGPRHTTTALSSQGTIPLSGQGNEALETSIPTDLAQDQNDVHGHAASGTISQMFNLSNTASEPWERQTFSPQEPAPQGSGAFQSLPEPEDSGEDDAVCDKQEEKEGEEAEIHVKEEKTMVKTEKAASSRRWSWQQSQVGGVDVIEIQSSKDSSPVLASSGSSGDGGDGAGKAFKGRTSIRSNRSFLVDDGEESSDLEDFDPFASRNSFLLRDIPESELRRQTLSPDKPLYPKLPSLTPEPEQARRKSSRQASDHHDFLFAGQARSPSIFQSSPSTSSPSKPVSGRMDDNSRLSSGPTSPSTRLSQTWRGKMMAEEEEREEVMGSLGRFEDTLVGENGQDRMSLRRISGRSIEIEIPVRQRSARVLQEESEEEDDDDKEKEEGGRVYRQSVTPPRKEESVSQSYFFSPSPPRELSLAPQPLEEEEEEEEVEVRRDEESESRRASYRRISSNSFALANMMDQFERRESTSSTVSTASQDSDSDRRTSYTELRDYMKATFAVVADVESTAAHATIPAKKEGAFSETTTTTTVVVQEEGMPEGGQGIEGSSLSTTKKRKRKLRAKKAVFEEEMSETVRASSPPVPMGTKLARRRIGRKPFHQ